MAYDYGKSPAARRRAPAQGKHAKSGARAVSRGRHAAVEKTAGTVQKVVAPEATPAVKAAQRTRRTRTRKQQVKRAYGRLPSSDKRQSGILHKGVNRSPMLVAEFFAGAALIVITMISRGGKEGYQSIMSDMIIRLSALTAVFFVLFLFAGGKRSGEAAAWFGLLIDIGILFAAAQKQDLSKFASAITGHGVGGQGITLASDITETPTEFHETQGIQLQQGDV